VLLDRPFIKTYLSLTSSPSPDSPGGLLHGLDEGAYQTAEYYSADIYLKVAEDMDKVLLYEMARKDVQVARADGVTVSDSDVDKSLAEIYKKAHAFILGDVV
jgi:hypothetical protein